MTVTKSAAEKLKFESPNFLMWNEFPFEILCIIFWTVFWAVFWTVFWGGHLRHFPERFDISIDGLVWLLVAGGLAGCAGLAARQVGLATQYGWAAGLDGWASLLTVLA